MGNFLWAKLVLRDIRRLLEAAPQPLAANALQYLWRKLAQTPNDLTEYYKTTVQRIPRNLCQKAFCLFEVVAKGDEVYLADVPRILSCLQLSHFEERHQALRTLGKPSYKELALSLETLTGNLIQIYDDKTPNPKLRLVHQTAVDFVQLPEFKNLILGSEAHVMSENGHTFLAKLTILRDTEHLEGPSNVIEWSKGFIRHARLTLYERSKRP
ncbi:hypothetical protein TgHK011_003569 [Trichoderma gracile]|nr:hypothetical protein TgHK011_003569 [Trichoderma gracile]